MLSENIRRFRLRRGLCQEELAAELHIVRQTLSKWENGRSAPDADQLLRLARALDVTVNDLLGIENEAAPECSGCEKESRETSPPPAEDKTRAEENSVRGGILTLPILALLASVLFRNEWISFALTTAAMLLALVLFYRHLPLLSKPLDPGGLPILRTMSVTDGLVFLSMMISAALLKLGVIPLPGSRQELFAALLVAAVIIVTGSLSARLPHNRYTGLRLPWTVLDPGAWNTAHRCLGLLSAPLGILYIALTPRAKNFEALTLFTVLLWLGIPGTFSWIQYRKKYRSAGKGRREMIPGRTRCIPT